MPRPNVDKVRSYLNIHLPTDDPQVISLSFSEIEAAQITKQKLKYYKSRGNAPTTEDHTYLDLFIRDGNSHALREKLKYERTTIVHKDTGICKVSTKAVHYPVSVPECGIIRIQWRCPSSHIAHGIRKVSDMLARKRVNIRPMQRQVKDYTKTDSIDVKTAEAQILELAEKGKILAATKLARKVYNYNTTEARQFVDGLMK